MSPWARFAPSRVRRIATRRESLDVPATLAPMNILKPWVRWGGALAAAWLIGVGSGVAWLESDLGQYCGSSRWLMSRAIEAVANDRTQSGELLLERVLASKYGYNVAENAVRGQVDVQLRQRLWKALIRAADAETWRSRYEHRYLEDAVPP